MNHALPVISETTSADVMTPVVITVLPEMSVRDVTKVLLEARTARFQSSTLWAPFWG